MHRRIAVFTGNRAEYGLLFPVLKAISIHPALDYRLVVAGAHLDPNFGRTVAEIEADGFVVHAQAAINLDGDTLLATAKAIGSGICLVADMLARLEPDLFVVYADRFEGFSALIAATQMGIPTAHIEGGDVTEGGALDDSVRHAMTKLAHLHFTTNADAARRIRAMGEESWRVHNVGFPAIDLIKAGVFAPSQEIQARFGLDPSRPLVVFTQHSVTTEFDQAGEQVQPALEAMARLVKEGVQVVATYSNNDAGGRRIIARLEQFAARHSESVVLRRSVGRHDYHGLLNLCGRVGRGVCVGNSSSGIKETPAFGCPTVDIGTRQQGRLAAENVLHVGYDSREIETAIRRGLFDESFRDKCASCENPYGEGNAGPRIAEVLSNIPLDRRLLVKRMTI